MTETKMFNITLKKTFTHVEVKKVEARDLDQAIELAKAGAGKLITTKQHPIEITALSSEQVGGKRILSGD